MVCFKCGYQMPDGMKFCPSCGAPQQQAQQPQNVQQQYQQAPQQPQQGYIPQQQYQQPQQGYIPPQQQYQQPQYGGYGQPPKKSKYLEKKEKHRL